MKPLLIFFILICISSCVFFKKNQKEEEYFNKNGIFVCRDNEQSEYVLTLFRSKFIISKNDSRPEDKYLGTFGVWPGDTLIFLATPMYPLVDYDSAQDIAPLPEEEFFGMIMHNDTIKLWGKTFVRQECECFE